MNNFSFLNLNNFFKSDLPKNFRSLNWFYLFRQQNNRASLPSPGYGQIAQSVSSIGWLPAQTIAMSNFLAILTDELLVLSLANLISTSASLCFLCLRVEERYKKVCCCNSLAKLYLLSLKKKSFGLDRNFNSWEFSINELACQFL